MQPCEALCPMDAGRLVPWMPYPLRLRPSHRVPSGLALPGGTILPLVYQVGSGMRATIWYCPVGLGVLAAPTAVGKIFTTFPASTTASFLSAMLTMILRSLAGWTRGVTP